MAENQRSELRYDYVTLEKVGRDSIESKLFLLTESVFKSFKYSRPVSLPMQLLFKIKVYSFIKCPIFSIF
jgi:hypothetical protein